MAWSAISQSCALLFTVWDNSYYYLGFVDLDFGDEVLHPQGLRIENFNDLAALLGVLSLLWALPGMPGFVVLTVFVNAAQVVLLPLVSIGLILMINRKDLMGDSAGNKLHTVLLIILSILAVYGAYNTLLSIIG